MEAKAAIFVGIMGVLSFLSKVPNFDDRKRIIEGEIEYFNAKMQDFKRELKISSNGVGKKRKRDECQWMIEGDKFVEESRRVLRPVSKVQGWRNLIKGLKMRWDVYKLSCGLKLHDQILGDHVLLKQPLCDATTLCRGYLIPVNRVVGELAIDSLDYLKHLLVDGKVARIAISGIRGIGKTFLMKHLHNYAYALDCFDYVLWVSCPCEFTVKCVQDAVAAAVKCDFSVDDDLAMRTAKLSNAFAKLGSFALFLDGVPKPGFSLDKAGIPVPAEGSKCKLVLTTSSTSSALECSLLDCFETVEIERLPKQDAYELFMYKANIGKETISSLHEILCSLADRCFGIPCMIENIATSLRSIDDPYEWRCALYELGNLSKNKKFPLYPAKESDSFLNSQSLG